MMSSQRNKLFALFVKPHHANNRLLIEGMARFTQKHPQYHFKLITPEMLQKSKIKDVFDGIISQTRNTQIDKAADEANIPLVDVRNSQPSTRSTIVDSDNVAIGRLAAEHFLERRFTDFAFFGYKGTPYSIQRKEGFVSRLAEAGYKASIYEADTSRWPSTKDWALPGFDESTVRDVTQIKNTLRKLPRHTAVFCCHDPRAISVLETCRINGIDIPHDIAILGVDNDSIYGAFSYPRLSSVDPSTEEIGFQAAREMAELSETAASRRKRRTILIPPSGVITRESTECYPLNPQWMSDALVFIKRNATKGISATDVFTHLGRSHTQVQDAFRSVLKSSVQKEIIAVRMDEAKRLLTENRQPISDIARECGFASLHYFSQAFATYTGLSPSDFLLGANPHSSTSKSGGRQPNS